MLETDRQPRTGTGIGGTEKADTPGVGAAIGADEACVEMEAMRLEADDHTRVCPSAPISIPTGACADACTAQNIPEGPSSRKD